MAALSGHSDNRKPDRRRVSCETLCSSNSSCVLQKRKPLHPLAASVRRTSNNPVTQRVLSAKLLRFKTLQNQLNDANYHISQLVNENKILKNLQKRQDHALSKYEGVNAQLPQVLESHQEEIRVSQVKYKNLRKSLKDLSDQLKNKDEEINSLKDQNKHLLSLCKNKNLEERQELQNKVEDLEERIRQNESTISMLNRKLMLESKNYKFKLNSEVTKHKQTQRELHKALGQLQESTSTSEIKLPDSARKSSSKIKSQSVVHLSDTKINIRKSPAKDKISSSSLTNLDEDILSPSSSSLVKSQNIQEASSLSETSVSPEQDLDSSSEAQLKEIVNSWHRKNSKIEENVDKEMKKCHAEAMSDMRYYNNTVDKHTEDFKNSLKETEIILKSIKETDAKHEILSKEKMSFYDYTLLSNKTTNDHLMNQILKKDKYSFEEDLLSETANSLTISEPEVDREDKKKLLAKLKAIDNGDSIVVTDIKQAKCDLMKELFGS